MANNISSAALVDQLPLLSRGHRQPLTYIDLIFGGYILLLIALAIVAWVRGEGSGRSVVVFLVFMVANGVVSALSARAARPQRVELGRAAVGALVAPAALST